jgi:hypothetical protein
MDTEHQVSNSNSTSTSTDTGATTELQQAAALHGHQQPLHVRAPFPIIALPRVLRAFVQATADALGVCPEYIATPAIATCATAIGNTHRIGLQPGWTEPSVIWAATLVEGRSQTAAYQAAIAPLKARQEAHDAYYQHETDLYKELKHVKKTDPARWKDLHLGEEPELEEPKAAVLLTAKCSVQALLTLLADNLRGLALTQDDLSGFFSKDDPGGGGRGKCAEYLEFYNAETIKRHRPNGKPLFVQNAALSIFGTCQAAAFRKAIGVEGHSRNPVENLLAARFIVTSPATGTTPLTVPILTTPQTVREPGETGDYHRLIDKLLALPLIHDVEAFLRPQPTIVPLLPRAQEQFATFVTEHEQQIATLGKPTLRSHYANLVPVAARLALIFYLCDQATQQLGDLSGGKGVQERHMLAGIALARWYGREAMRVHGGHGSNAQWVQQDLLKLIRNHGGSITPRALGRVRERWANPEAAELALRALERDGHGKFVTEPADGGGRGRPSFRFQLFEHAAHPPTDKNAGTLGNNDYCQ